MVSRSKAEAAAPIEPGLHLVIGEGGVVLRSAPIRNVSRQVLEPPFLTPKTLSKITTTMSELVLEELSPEGQVLDSFGWPWTTEAFYDRPIRKGYENVRAGRIRSFQTLRILRVPVPPSTAFLLFSQSRVIVGPGPDATPEALPRADLTLYSFISPAPPRPPLLDFAAGLEARPLPGRLPLVEPR